MFQILDATGFDGGQRQWFVMEIFDQQTQQLQANISSRYPIFTIAGLDAGRFLRIVIFAVNGKGASEPVTLETFTLKTAEKQMGTTQNQFEITPVLTVGIFIGVLTAISCIALGTIVAIKMRTMRRHRHANHAVHDGQAGGKSTRPGNLPIKEKIAMPLGSGDMDELYDDKNPDVVPCNEGMYEHRCVLLNGVLGSLCEHPPSSLVGSCFSLGFIDFPPSLVHIMSRVQANAFSTVRRKAKQSNRTGEFGTDVEFPPRVCAIFYFSPVF